MKHNLCQDRLEKVKSSSVFCAQVDEKGLLNRKFATFDAGNSMLWNYLLHNMFVVVLTGKTTSFYSETPLLTKTTEHSPRQTREKTQGNLL